MPYPHTDIWINGRRVLLDDITAGRADALSPAEQHTFGFVRDWFSETDTFVVQTSGTTGAPKQITFRRDQFTAGALMTLQALELSASTPAISCIDTRYIGGKMMLVRSFVGGMPLYITDPSANPFLHLPTLRSAFAAMVPYQIQAVLTSEQASVFHELHTVIIGGAPLDEKTAEKLAPYRCRFYATYGMTETLSHIALKRLNGEEKQSYFQTLPAVHISRDDRGCLLIEADHLEGKVVTNDLVEIIAQNKFQWLGRWDNVINTGGIKVSPEKVEEVVAAIFNSLNIRQRFFIHGVDDARLGKKVTLIIEGTDPLSPVFEAALSAIRHQLSPYERPRLLLRADAFVYTETGKINRAASFQRVIRSFKLAI